LPGLWKSGFRPNGFIHHDPTIHNTPETALNAVSTKIYDPIKNGAPNQSTTNGNIDGGDHSGEKKNDKKGNGKVQQQQQEDEGKPLSSDSKNNNKSNFD
jgi:hypothetical protein